MADDYLSKLESRSVLRILARNSRDALSNAERSSASSCIAQSVCALAEARKAWSILAYSAFRSEVETEELCRLLLRMDKKLCLPLTRQKDKDLLPIVVKEEDFPLQPGYQGIQEPEWCAGKIFAAQELDIVIVPGLLFDRNGNRLGYGGGYYDRFLACKASQALRVGLAFSCQLVPFIPAQSHDIPMDILITEKGILRWPRI